jgi:hypothetical protein
MFCILETFCSRRHIYKNPSYSHANLTFYFNIASALTCKHDSIAVYGVISGQLQVLLLQFSPLQVAEFIRKKDPAVV